MASSSPELQPLSTRASFLLSQLGAHCALRFGSLLEPFGLNPRQFGVLSILDSGAGMSQQQLGEALSIHRNSMVALIDDLESNHLIERRRHPKDRRAHALHPTDKARTLLGRAHQALNDLESELFKEMSAKDQRTLTALLTRVADETGLLPGVHPSLQRNG